MKTEEEPCKVLGQERALGMLENERKVGWHLYDKVTYIAEVVREIGKVGSFQGFEECRSYLKSNGKGTIIFLMIEMVFWLLCGEWIREGWRG